MQPADRPELLYIYDPLCGWCYGMTPMVQRARAAFAGRLDVSVLSGGMVTGERVGPIRDKWGYISGALQHVEKAAGIRFGEAFLQLGKEGSYIQNSEPPCRALTVFRQLDTQHRALDFAHDIQLALFRDGQDLNAPATYEPLLAPYGLDEAEFGRRLALPGTVAATRQEFAAVARIGVQGFPTAVLRVGGEGYVVARGFQSYEAFVGNLELALQQASKEHENN